jgi:hypothetical protein
MSGYYAPSYSGFYRPRYTPSGYRRYGAPTYRYPYRAAPRYAPPSRRILYERRDSGRRAVSERRLGRLRLERVGGEEERPGSGSRETEVGSVYANDSGGSSDDSGEELSRTGALGFTSPAAENVIWRSVLRRVLGTDGNGENTARLAGNAERLLETEREVVDSVRQPDASDMGRLQMAGQRLRGIQEPSGPVPEDSGTEVRGSATVRGALDIHKQHSPGRLVARIAARRARRHNAALHEDC